MAGETILVIDASQDLDQKITTALEAKGYLVFTESSHVVTPEVVEHLRPSLIYFKPLELSATGFEPCRAIHAFPPLKNVPFVILASQKRALYPKGDPRYFRDYGVVDFLKLTFDQDELIKKTEKVLSKTRGSERHKENTGAAEDPVSGQAVKRKERKHSASLLLGIGAAILLVIAGVTFLLYRHTTPTWRVTLPTLTVRSPVPSAVPQTGRKPVLPPGRNVQDTSAAAFPSAAAPPAQGPSSSLPVSKPSHKPFHSVQVGAFRNEEYAQEFMKKLQGKGYDAFIQQGSTKDKVPIYRVLIGKHEDRKAAEELAREIESKEQIKTTLFSE